MPASTSPPSALEQLTRLSLISKIATELDQHLGTADRDLAEFILHLAQTATSDAEFRTSIKGLGVELADELVQRLYKLTQVSTAKPVVKDDKPAVQAPATAVPAATLRAPSAAPAVKAEQRPAAPVTTHSTMHPSRMQQISGTKRSRSPPRYDQRNDSRKPDVKYRDEPQHQRNAASNDGELREGQIHRGTVDKISTFGAFVKLAPPHDKHTGLVHISQVRPHRVTDINDELKRNQQVYVKVIQILISGKIELSMKHVDQQTGEDLKPSHMLNTDNSASHQTYGQQRINKFEDTSTGSRAAPYMSEHEQWELAQLKKAGAMRGSGVKQEESKSDVYMPSQRQVTLGQEEDNEELEIELNEDEPAFLRGHVGEAARAAASSNADAIKIVRMPDGSLSRAALTQSALAKERREAREAEKQAAIDAVPAELSRHWEDPMAKQNDRLLASELRAIGTGIVESKSAVPEWKAKTLMKNATFGRITNLTIQQQREELPIFKLKQQFMEAVASNNVMVVIGETGSGKTTQMTQYLMEGGFCGPGRTLACTQPRRVAATSVAKRVAEEVGCKLGTTVGYSIRFEDCTSSETIIKYMTDGMLLREILSDKLLSRYSVIILDEAHERTINTDILFGLLVTLLKTRKDLKLIVTSATLDAEKFSDYFGKAPIFTIPGRMFPVVCLFEKQPVIDYLDEALMTIMRIHLSQPPGDILVFLTGKEEIDSSCEILYERVQQLGSRCPPLVVLPVYSALPNEIQSKVFEPAAQGERKCIIATNIAEASVTLPGIIYVVDPGFVKQKIFNQKLNMDTLQVVPISQASAKQRAGRAGRTAPGRCYRLYTEQSFHYEMLQNSIPEIQRVNLNMTILQLKAIGITDILNFPFMDAPDSRAIVMALSNLYTLGALDEEGLLSRIGLRMAEFPLEPNLAKILISSTDAGCSQEMLTIVAMLSIESVFYRPKERQAAADTKRSRFFAPEGDHLTLLNVYQAWEKANFSASFAHDNYLHSRQLKRAQEIRGQIQALLERYRLPIVSCGRRVEVLQKCICSGYFMNAAKKDPTEGFKTLVDGQPVFIHPSSALFNRQPEWIIYHNLVLTTKEYLHGVMAISPKWLIEVAPQFYKSAGNQALSKRKRNERIEPLHDKYNKPNAWRLSKRQG